MGLGKPAELTSLLGMLNKHMGNTKVSTKKQRLAAWREKTRQDMVSRPGKVYSAVKGASHPQTRFLQRDDGTNTFTADLEEMDDILHSPQAWGLNFLLPPPLYSRSFFSAVALSFLSKR
eukprot:Rhum_TRINITY_DN14200_c0_g3::Rhum_TRINITY_DN14200_c0_g3_i1::g.73415::m.73415